MARPETSIKISRQWQELTHGMALLFQHAYLVTAFSQPELHVMKAAKTKTHTQLDMLTVAVQLPSDTKFSLLNMVSTALSITVQIDRYKSDMAVS